MQRYYSICTSLCVSALYDGLTLKTTRKQPTASCSAYFESVFRNLGRKSFSVQLTQANYRTQTCYVINIRRYHTGNVCFEFRFSLSNAQMKGLLPYLPPILHKDPSTSPKWEALRCPYPMNVTCSPVDVYRTYDGRCNNLVKPLWGSSHQPLARFLPPDYADGETR